jgi:hypothetical protein
MSTESDPPAPRPSAGAEDPLVAPREKTAAVQGHDLEATPGAESPGVSDQTPSGGRQRHGQSPNMLPAREKRRSVFERLIVRLIATAGVVAIGVAIAAIMVSSDSQGWVVGLVVSIVTVVLSGLLWSSRQL